MELDSVIRISNLCTTNFLPADHYGISVCDCCTSCVLLVILTVVVLSTGSSLTQQREAGLNLSPELLVHQRVLPAVQTSPRGDSLPAKRTAERRFVH